MGQKLDWAEYFRRRREFRVILLFVAPICFLFITKLPGAWPGANGQPFGPFPLAALPLLLLGVASYRKNGCPCPACGRPVHFTRLCGNPFSRYCLHCGARIGGEWKPPVEDWLD